jgi:branched-subunit amino acid transport protein
MRALSGQSLEIRILYVRVSEDVASPACLKQLLQFYIISLNGAIIVISLFQRAISSRHSSFLATWMERHRNAVTWT